MNASNERIIFAKNRAREERGRLQQGTVSARCTIATVKSKERREKKIKIARNGTEKKRRKQNR